MFCHCQVTTAVLHYVQFLWLLLLTTIEGLAFNSSSVKVLMCISLWLLCGNPCCDLLSSISLYTLVLIVDLLSLLSVLMCKPFTTEIVPGELIVSRYVAESITTDAGCFGHVGLCPLRKTKVTTVRDKLYSKHWPGCVIACRSGTREAHHHRSQMGKW